MGVGLFHSPSPPCPVPGTVKSWHNEKLAQDRMLALASAHLLWVSTSLAPLLDSNREAAAGEVELSCYTDPTWPPTRPKPASCGRGCMAGASVPPIITPQPWQGVQGWGEGLLQQLPGIHARAAPGCWPQPVQATFMPLANVNIGSVCSHVSLEHFE